jgi:hypothetical protein
MASETKGAPSQVAAGHFRKINRGGDSAPIYVTRSGAEFVRASELLKSVAAQRVVKDLAGRRLSKTKV